MNEEDDDYYTEVHPSEEENNNSEDNLADDKSLVVASRVYPGELIIIPLKERPLFPGMVVPVYIQSPHAVEAIKRVLKTEKKYVGFLLLKKQSDNKKVLREKDLYKVGTVAQVVRHNLDVEEASGQILVQGLDRFSVKNFTHFHPFIQAKIAVHREKEYRLNEEMKAYALAVIQAIKELMQYNPLFKEEIKLILNRTSLEEPGKLADFAASLTSVDKEKIQEILEEFRIKKRIDKTLLLLKEEINVSKMKNDITKQIEKNISQHQREFFLREQLKIIKKELGMEKDEKTEEVERIKKRMEKLSLPQEAKKKIDEELEKLSYLEPRSPEYAVTRNYLDWLTSLPWGIYKKDNYDLKKIRKILDEDHYGLDDLKKNITEFIGVARLKGGLSGTILCLIGPPGVGKTSVGRSIARALGRDFFRFSLGGIRDEAEIKGHRRTYIGAMPGKIIQALKNVQSANPVIMLDEMDKIGMSFQGDPASALLEVLDPEQNAAFRDHYLDVPFDLSKILFIGTANVIDTIPAPLVDRMEILRLSGYIQEEKLKIAEKFLLPKLYKDQGIKKTQVKFGRRALRYIIDGYSREAGVRSLEKNLRKVLRKIAVEIVEGNNKKFNIKSRGDVEKYLGKPIYKEKEIIKKLKPGVAIGLAWTALGGETLYVEAVSIFSKEGDFKQTGQLGNVMVESSYIAYTYVRSHIQKFGGNENFFNQHFIHLHVPAGATPKDGPSAGITMATALVSLALNRRVSSKVAMTGELTTTGRVLPVGGIKEKVIAAKRAKIKTLLLPEDNKKDFIELADHLKKNLEVIYVKDYSQVFSHVFPEKNE